MGGIGIGEGVCSVGAADIARGVGNGLGLVRTVRVIAVYKELFYESPLPVEPPWLLYAHVLGFSDSLTQNAIELELK